MTTLYPTIRPGGIVWRDFVGEVHFHWWPGLDWTDSSTGLLRGARYTVNDWVTRAQAERLLRQLGHKIGEWDG